MQNVSDMEITENDFLTAEQMREITATPEELFEAQVNSIKENLMSTMVKIASQQGRKFYAAQFLKQGNEKLVETISAYFEENGYKTQQAEIAQKNGDQEIPVTVLTVSWES